MTVTVPEALLCEDEWIEGEGKSDENDSDERGSENSLLLDGGFVVPEKNAFGQDFRDYCQASKCGMGVEEFYRIHHFKQTYEFALSKREQYGKLGKCVMNIWECCQLLSEYVDESDPDLDEPQIEHLLQTAEAIRKDYPNEDWLHLTAFIHDLGKVLLHPRFGEEPQWAVVGDTYPVGCAFDESIVHHKYLMENPDYHNPKYNTKYGIYSEKCGLDNVVMSWGHDEYMYMVAKHNNTTLPRQALFIVRFHSFYALYGNGAYTHLMNDQDKEMVDWLKKFSKYDLYSKSNVRIDVEAVKPYYLSLAEKARTLRNGLSFTLSRCDAFASADDELAWDGAVLSFGTEMVIPHESPIYHSRMALVAFRASMPMISRWNVNNWKGYRKLA